MLHTKSYTKPVDELVRDESRCWLLLAWLFSLSFACNKKNEALSQTLLLP